MWRAGADGGKYGAARGFKVTIYAKERPPYVRSARATGSWTPDSRIALSSAAPANFAAEWESMARTSFAMYQSYLGMAGTPVEWTDWYYLRDRARDENPSPPQPSEHHDFAHYGDRIADLTPESQDIPAGAHPFPTEYVHRDSSLTFNIADYSRQLMNDFMIAGGIIETREFHSPQDLASLPERWSSTARAMGLASCGLTRALFRFVGRLLG